MVSKLSAGIVSAALLGVAAPAMAQTSQGNPGEQAYVVPHIGYDNLALSAGPVSLHKGGLSYGGTVGVDTPTSSRTRVGLELGVANTNGSLDLLYGTYRFTGSQGRSLTASAKFGWMVTPALEAFALVGYANTRLQAQLFDGNTLVASGHNDMNGYRFGGGIEYFLSKHVRLRGEYTHTDLGKLRINGYDTGLKARKDEVSTSVVYGF